MALFFFLRKNNYPELPESQPSNTTLKLENEKPEPSDSDLEKEEIKKLAEKVASFKVALLKEQIKEDLQLLTRKKTIGRGKRGLALKVTL